MELQRRMAQSSPHTYIGYNKNGRNWASRAALLIFGHCTSAVSGEGQIKFKCSDFWHTLAQSFMVSGLAWPFINRRDPGFRIDTDLDIEMGSDIGIHRRNFIGRRENAFAVVGGGAGVSVSEQRERRAAGREPVDAGRLAPLLGGFLELQREFKAPNHIAHGGAVYPLFLQAIAGDLGVLVQRLWRDLAPRVCHSPPPLPENQESQYRDHQNPTTHAANDGADRSAAFFLPRRRRLDRLRYEVRISRGQAPLSIVQLENL
nr:hypothetical protein Iba_chr02dCG9840 [Ipomoea batatas]